jgi:hypothetical protein
LARKVLLRTIAFFGILLIIVGAAVVGVCLIDIYMVGVAGVPPGEPMYVDELAYPISDALVIAAKGIALIVVGSVGGEYARRKLRAAS